MDIGTILNIHNTFPAGYGGQGSYGFQQVAPSSWYGADRGVDTRRLASLNLEQAYANYMTSAKNDSTVATGRGFYIISGQQDQQFQSFDELMKEMQRQLEEARRQAGQGGGAKPPGQQGNQKVNLDIGAHGYYEGDTWHPVKEIRAWEVNNYRNRTSKSFNGDWYESEYTMKWNDVAPAKYYRVKVTWDNGETRTWDVRPEAGGWKTKRYEFWH